MTLPLLWGFYLSTRSTVLCPLSRSMVEIFFTTPVFGDFNSQPSRFPRTLLSRVHKFLPRVLIKSTVLVHFGNLTFQLDQRLCGPFLDQRSRSPSGLQTSEISNIKLMLWIRWPRFTSDDPTLEIFFKQSDE
jgi:hypothetical protein